MVGLTKRINEAIPCVPTYLMELWWNFSPCLGRLKDGTIYLCLAYLASFLK
jgi:hypothetical protein